ncbi:hemicentin-1-like isoform X1 [Hypanus sabinus]|uniref:hemicentin-1-like isoform X1 n=2 Tax=Hypanus sabinus TaxID=79690 RepID=UPI0028C4ED90|nr:hemicentin-1-like isoform X1 [Hypanus sabinus]
MEFGLSAWTGYLCLFTSFFTVAEVGAEDLISIHAEPPAVEIGHRLEVTCTAMCSAASIVMEGIKDRNSTMQNNKRTYSVPSIQSWHVKVTSQVRCSAGPVQSTSKVITVYNRDLSISSPPEGLEINKTYSLECIGPRVNPEKKLILKWLRGSEIVQNDSAENVGSLYLNERLRSVFNFTAQSSDDGQVYTCLAEVLLDSNDTLPIANSSVTLKTYYKPRSIIILANNRTISESPIHLSDGDNITLVCDVEGNPKPTLTWEFPQKHNIANSSSAVLHIYDAMTENNGVYRCIATNKFGTAEKKVDVKVTGKTSVIVAASISAAVIATLATGAVIYYFYQKAQKIQKYKLQEARPNNNPQVPSG